MSRSAVPVAFNSADSAFQRCSAQVGTQVGAALARKARNFLEPREIGLAVATADWSSISAVRTHG